jgi:uncharacterized protein (DUF1501 family)
VPVATIQSIAEHHLQDSVPDLEHLQQTLAQLYSLDGRLADEAQNTLEAVDLLAGVDVAGYTPESQAEYPETEFGRAMMQIAQLVKAQIGLEVACIDMRGFDTHVNQGSVTGTLATLLSDLGRGLSAFYQDLGSRTGQVSVVTMSEFGRRAYENGNAGTDHGHGGVMFALGGGVNGQVYGDWPGLTEADLYGPGDLAVTTDYRDMLGELVQKRLGNAAGLTTIFPDYEVKTRGIFVPSGS